jgi:membrane protein
MQSKIPLLAKIEKFIGASRFERIIQWARTTSLPGFSGIPIHDIILFLYNESRRERLMYKVNSMAYSFLLALFPFFLFLFSLIPLLPIKGFKDTLFKELQPFIPDSVEPFLFKTIQDIISIKHNGILSISFIMALYFSTNATQAMMNAFEKSYPHTFMFRNFWQKRLDALRLVFLLAILLIASIIILIFGNEIWSALVNYFSRKKFIIENPLSYNSKENWVIRFLFFKKYSGLVFELFKWIISICLFQGVFALIFRYGPSLKKGFKLFSAGTTLATISSIGISLIFSAMINKFGSFHLVYGPIGGLIIILLYIQLNCFIIVTCFELNASIAIHRDLKAVIKD